jgi:7-keto-8-aminopelargonate synthetase-like enzyme
MSQLPPVIQQVDRTYARFRGKRYSYFSGCDYFRLASHPRVLQAARDGVRDYGLNVAASRVTTGNHPLYERLEKELAEFFGAGSALLVSSGYVTNLAVAQALAGEFSHALIDERSHGCLADGAAFLGARVIRFKHREVGSIVRVVSRLGTGTRPILLTDGMFSRDGSVAPLRAYRKALPRRAWMLVDDAHGAGILGKAGQGAVEFEGVGRRQLIQTITLSKAFGTYGGAILCPRPVKEKIISHSGLFIGNTPLPLPLANAALAALNIFKSDHRLRRRLKQNTDYFKGRLREAGLPLLDNPGPIIPVIPDRRRETEALKRRLLAAGIFPALTRYPGGPKEGYFRFVISSEHTRNQLDALAGVLIEHHRRRE